MPLESNGRQWLCKAEPKSPSLFKGLQKSLSKTRINKASLMERTRKVVPAKNGKTAKRKLAAGSFCSEFVVKVTNEEQSKLDATLFPFLMDTAAIRTRSQMRTITIIPNLQSIRGNANE